jgi:hypothetical protein
MYIFLFCSRTVCTLPFFYNHVLFFSRRVWFGTFLEIVSEIGEGEREYIHICLLKA